MMLRDWKSRYRKWRVSALQQKGREAAKILLQPRLVEGDVRQLQEVVLEVVQVPEDRLPVEGGARVGDE
jgi:hypothetical protein